VIISGSPPGPASTRAETISDPVNQRLMSISCTKEFVTAMAPVNQAGARALRWTLCSSTVAPMTPSSPIRFIS